MVLSKYRTSRHYGGSEEGGWWYSRYEHLETIAYRYTREELESIKEGIELQAISQRDNAERMASLPNIESSDPEGYIPSGFGLDYGEELIIEEVAREYDTTNEPTPHYE